MPESLGPAEELATIAVIFSQPPEADEAQVALRHAGFHRTWIDVVGSRDDRAVVANERGEDALTSAMQRLAGQRPAGADLEAVLHDHGVAARVAADIAHRVGIGDAVLTIDTGNAGEEALSILREHGAQLDAIDEDRATREYVDFAE